MHVLIQVRQVGIWILNMMYAHNYEPAIIYSVGPLMIELAQAKNRMSTGAFQALNDPCSVQTKTCKNAQLFYK